MDVIWKEYRTKSGLWSKTVLLCPLRGGARVSRQVADAVALFTNLTGRQPEYVFIQALPAGAEDGVEVDGTMLVQAETWMPGNYIGLWAKSLEVQ